MSSAYESRCRSWAFRWSERLLNPPVQDPAIPSLETSGKSADRGSQLSPG
jgi:hypothetical protein